MPACENGRRQRTAPSLMRNLAVDAVGRVDDEIGARRTCAGRLSRVERARHAPRPAACGNAPPQASRRRTRPWGVRSPRCGAGSGGADSRARRDRDRSGRSVPDAGRRQLRSAAGQPSAPMPTISTRAVGECRVRVSVPSLPLSHSAPKKRPLPTGQRPEGLSLSPYLPGVSFSRLELAPAPPMLSGTGCCGFVGPVPQPLWIRYRVNVCRLLADRYATRR